MFRVALVLGILLAIFIACGDDDGASLPTSAGFPTQHLPGSETRIVPGDGGWQLGVPDGVHHTGQVELWINGSKLVKGNSTAVALQVDPPPGARLTYLSVFLSGPGWLSQSIDASQQGNYLAKILELPSKKVLVQADFTVRD